MVNFNSGLVILFQSIIGTMITRQKIIVRINLEVFMIIRFTKFH